MIWKNINADLEFICFLNFITQWSLSKFKFFSCSSLHCSSVKLNWVYVVTSRILGTRIKIYYALVAVTSTVLATFFCFYPVKRLFCTHSTSCFATLLSAEAISQLLGTNSAHFYAIGKLRSQISLTHLKILTSSHLSVKCKKHPSF